MGGSRMIEPPNEIDLDGYFDEPKQVRYIGKATRVSGNLYRCMAIVAGALCVVEATITHGTPEIKPMKSVLQDWVMNIGLRQQGTLLSGLRGCDTVPKHHVTKVLVRGIRADCLNSWCGDATKAVSYIRFLSHEALIDMLPAVLDAQDELPSHYVSHLIHAIEVLAFCHPDLNRRSIWNQYYLRLCKRWHMRPETPEEMAQRLDAPEEKFAEQEDEV